MSASSPEIVRASAKMIAPIIVLFAAYLVAVGVDAPGGGLAGGAAFALGIIVYALVFGADAARRACPIWMMRVAMGLGVLGFVALGGVGIARGYAFLDYEALLQGPGLRTQRLGVWSAQIAQAFVAAGALVLGFYALAGRAGDMKDAEW